MLWERLALMAVFARVVDAGSFSAAARELGLSKSAVSKQVSRLEDRLGARLLNRTTRRLSLTEAGQAFYEHCRRLIEEAERAEERVDLLAAAPRGRLRVNAPMTFGQMHFAPCLGDFLAAYPEIAVEVTLEDRRVDLVQEGYDLAVRIGQLPDSTLVARRLAPLTGVLAAAPAYLDARGRPGHPDDLADHDCLLYTYLETGPVWRLRRRRSQPAPQENGEVRVDVSGRLRANNGDALRVAALGGAGIVMMPSFILADDLRSGALERVLPMWQQAGEGAIYAVFPATRDLLPKVRVFVDFLKVRIGDPPYWEVGLP